MKNIDIGLPQEGLLNHIKSDADVMKLKRLKKRTEV